MSLTILELPYDIMNLFIWIFNGSKSLDDILIPDSLIIVF